VRGQVDDRVAAVERLGERFAICEVADHGLGLVRAVVRRRAQVVVANVAPGLEQGVDDVGADEAGAAGDEDPAHPVAPTTAGSRSPTGAGA
jgi:hypothetical protein